MGNNAGIRAIVCALTLLIPQANGVVAGKAFGIKTVVIDAGHGGHDTGCLGSSAKEKEVTLAVALRLGKLIEDAFPDVSVVYTRKNDRFVELHERAGIANRAKADLFICIHANSGNPAAFGAETYVMGLHKTAENLAVSRRENASVLLESDYKTKYDGFDPNSPEANIIFTLFQNAFMNQSLNFASKVQVEFEEFAGRYNRGVKQAGFLVLYRTSMPAVLIETGFLTNKAEERYLLSKKGEGDMAESIFRAFKAYKVDMESLNPPAHVAAGDDSSSRSGSAAGKDKQPDPVNPSGSSAPAMAFFYTVQIGASSTARAAGQTRFNVKDMIPIAGDDGMTRFTVGRYASLDDAMQRQAQLRKQGFPDAFVTPYRDGKRISLKEAAQAENKN